MVKGISRRVIVVKSPDPNIFEEAIFLVKEDVSNRGVTQAEILKEAQSVASDYVRNNTDARKPVKISPIASALAGAGTTAVIWFLSHLL